MHENLIKKQKKKLIIYDLFLKLVEIVIVEITYLDAIFPPNVP